MKSRKYEIVVSVDKLKVNIQNICNGHNSIKQWVYILHNKCFARPHYHIYLELNNFEGTIYDVAAWFEVNPNFVEKAKGKKSDVLLYLIHGNDSHQGKHRYSPEEVVANFDWETEIENSIILGDF